MDAPRNVATTVPRARALRPFKIKLAKTGGRVTCFSAAQPFYHRNVRMRAGGDLRPSVVNVHDMDCAQTISSVAHDGPLCELIGRYADDGAIIRPCSPIFLVIHCTPCQLLLPSCASRC